MTAPAEDEWEYEYDQVETEDFYIAIDMSNIPQEQKQVASERRTGHPTLLKSRLRALNAQRGQQPDGAVLDSVGAHKRQEPGSAGEAQIIGLHTENPLVLYNGQLLSLQWAATIGTDLFFAEPEADAGSGAERKPLRALPGVDLLATSSAKLVARLGRLRPRDELFEIGAEAGGQAAATAALSGTTDGQAGDEVEVVEVPQDSFLARLNAAKAKRGESTRLAVSSSGGQSNLVAAAVGTAPTAAHSAAEGGGDVEMSGA